MGAGNSDVLSDIDVAWALAVLGLDRYFPAAGLQDVLTRQIIKSHKRYIYMIYIYMIYIYVCYI